MTRPGSLPGVVLAALCALAAACGDGGSVARYRATYSLVEDVADLRSLIAEVNYGDGIGPFANSVGEPMTCRPLDDSLLVAASDEGLGVASLHLLAVGGPCPDCGIDDADPSFGARSTLNAGRALFECELDLQGAVRVENFAARVMSADDSAGRPLDPLPDLAVDFVPLGSGGAASNGIFDVRFVVAQQASLGALQFDAVFSGDGDWRSGDRCSFKVPASLATCAAKGNGLLTCSMVSLDGIDTPDEVAVCEIASPQAEITDEQITVIVVDASDSDLRPIEIGVRASAYPDGGGAAPPSVGDPVYDVTFTLASWLGPVGSLHFEADYVGERGGWLGTGAGVDCTWLVGAGVSACSDAGAGRLNCAFASIEGVQTPTAVVSCPLATPHPVFASSFDVRTVAASDPDFGSLNAVVSVGSIVARDDDPEDEPPRGSIDYDVSVGVVDDVGRIGALQFELEYRGDSGGWVGARAGVECVWPNVRGSAIFACNDPGAGKVRCAFADIVGFATPLDAVVVCTLRTDDETLTPADFDLRSIDASDPEFGKLDPELAVTAVQRR